jgi:hypothetical protein
MVLQLNNLVALGSKMSVGTGYDIDFWSDRWLGDFTLDYLFPHAYASTVNKQTTVREVWDNGQWNIHLG